MGFWRGWQTAFTVGDAADLEADGSSSSWGRSFVYEGLEGQRKQLLFWEFGISVFLIQQVLIGAVL